MKCMRALLVLMLLPLTACLPEKIDLVYAYDSPAIENLTYIMEARASAKWDIGDPGSGTYRVRFEVSERLEPESDGSATVSVSMTPLDVEEDGLLSPGSEERSFVLRLGRNGEKLEVLEIDGVAATSLDDDELALIGTYRPPLPLEPVGLDDTWDARQQLDLGSVFQQVAMDGVLEGLHRDDRGNRIAELSYSGAGPVSQKLMLPQGEASLTGETDITLDAELDVDDGVLLTASSHTVGSFEARVVPRSEEAPIVGTLQLDLELELYRVLD